MSQPPSAELRASFGEIDIYLFDQLAARALRRPAPRCSTPAAATAATWSISCATASSATALDRDAGAVAHVRRLAAALAPALPADTLPGRRARSRCPGPTPAWRPSSAAPCCTLPTTTAHFGRMVERAVARAGAWRPAVRAAGVEHRPRARDRPGGRRVRLPDGSDRFVVDEAMLLAGRARLGGRLVDPIKTTNVQQQRCMTTWCVLKPG